MQLVCLLTSVGNKTRLEEISLLSLLPPWVYQNLHFSGGERGRFFQIDQMIIGFRWEYLVWLLWTFMNAEPDCGSGGGEETGSVVVGKWPGQSHNYNWLDGSLYSSDDLGLRINSGHLPLWTGPGPGPHKTKPSSSPAAPAIIFQNNKISSQSETETNLINLYWENWELRWITRADIFLPSSTSSFRPQGTSWARL